MLQINRIDLDSSSSDGIAWWGQCSINTRYKKKREDQLEYRLGTFTGQGCLALTSQMRLMRDHILEMRGHRSDGRSIRSDPQSSQKAVETSRKPLDPTD